MNNDNTKPDAGSGGDARFYAHPSGDGSICRSGSTTRLCLDELLAALNSVAARQPVGVELVAEIIEELAEDVESCVSDACGYLASDNGWRDYGIYRDDAAKRYHALPDRIRALAAPPAPAAVPVDGEVSVIEALLDLAFAAWSLADDAEDNDETLTVDRAGFDKLSECLDKLDALPDDQPGYIMEAAAKARWALRRLLATHPQPAAAKE